MSPKSAPLQPDLGHAVLNQLALDCLELESLAHSIRQTIDRLDPKVTSDDMAIPALMTLVSRIEAAEQSLIKAATRIVEMADQAVQRRQRHRLGH